MNINNMNAECCAFSAINACDNIKYQENVQMRKHPASDAEARLKALCSAVCVHA